MSAKGTQVQSKKTPKSSKNKKAPCPHICQMIPANVPDPGPAQEVLHPRKDVFVFKVAKVGAAGDRRCKMELELVTPKRPEKKIPARVDTRETQCDPDPQPCCCCGGMHRTKKK